MASPAPFTPSVPERASRLPRVLLVLSVALVVVLLGVFVLYCFGWFSSVSRTAEPARPVPVAPAVKKSVVPAAPRPIYAWLRGRAPVPSVMDRFPAPAGFDRVPAAPGSFADWLRQFPLKPGVPKVLLFNGVPKPDQNAHVAVLDLDLSPRDLQQCADSVIRLRAEYLYSANRAPDVAFHFTSGHLASFSQWSQGYRPVVSGRKVSWKQSAKPDSGYDSFRRYLDTVFVYASTVSLANELSVVRDVNDVRIGDVFIHPGSPGHAVIVVDVVENAAHRRLFLLAQGYMPAQEMHILKNPSDPGASPWYSTPVSDPLLTPEYTFTRPSLRRFPD